MEIEQIPEWLRGVVRSLEQLAGQPEADRLLAAAERLTSCRLGLEAIQALSYSRYNSSGPAISDSLEQSLHAYWLAWSSDAAAYLAEATP